MGTKSKFFRAFVEGNTISDGRQITAAMIDEIVSTFHAATYTPRINVEHLSGYSPEPPFNGYGDVVAVKAQTDDIQIAGKTEKRRALYCQVDANDQLVALGERDQKPFPSVELTDSYAGTGKIGLIGLAFTDSPASIATQRLSFSRTAPGTIRAHADEAVTLAFDAAPSDPAKVESAIAGFFNALASKFKTGEPAPEHKPEPKVPANDNVFDPAAFATSIGETVKAAIGAALTPVNQAHAALAADFATLKTTLETTETPNSFRRAPTGGGGAAILTDC